MHQQIANRKEHVIRLIFPCSGYPQLGCNYNWYSPELQALKAQGIGVYKSVGYANLQSALIASTLFRQKEIVVYKMKSLRFFLVLITGLVRNPNCYLGLVRIHLERQPVRAHTRTRRRRTLPQDPFLSPLAVDCRCTNHTSNSEKGQHITRTTIETQSHSCLLPSLDGAWAAPHIPGFVFDFSSL